jgi:hypothetical protein
LDSLSVFGHHLEWAVLKVGRRMGWERRAFLSVSASVLVLFQLVLFHLASKAALVHDRRTNSLA